MKVYQTKPFARFARKAGVSSAALIEAAKDVAEGRYDADLGGGVFKQRVARPGGGRSGGFRTIIFFRGGDQMLFMEGFAKNEKANLTRKELEALKKLADAFLSMSPAELAETEAQGDLIELEIEDGE